MELFAQILGMTMIVLGLIGFTACVVGLFYVHLFRKDPQLVTEQNAPAATSDNPTGT